MSGLTIAILGGLGAMVGWGVADFFAKLSIDDVGELQSLAWGHLVGTLILGVAAGIRAATATHIRYGHMDAGAVASIIFFGVLQAAVYFLLYKGFAVGQLSVLSPTFAAFSGIVALVSLAFLGETANVAKVVALVIIFGGVIMLSIVPTEGQRLRAFGAAGFNAVFLATLLAAGWTLGWDRLIHGRDPVSLAFFMYASMTAALFVVAAQQGELAVPKSISALRFFPVIGLGEAAAYVALSWGYSRTNLTSVVALLSGAFSLPTIVLARTFLRERLIRTSAIGLTAVLLGVGGLALLR